MRAEEERPRSAELGTTERLASTARSTVDALAHQGHGEHETEHGLGSTTVPDDVAAITEGWPAPQREVAVQTASRFQLAARPTAKPPDPSTSQAILSVES